MVLITGTPDLLLERLIQWGLPEHGPCDVLSNSLVTVPQRGCAQLSRASVDVLRMGQRAPSKVHRGLRMREMELQMTCRVHATCSVFFIP